ncbi:Ring-h2 finger protein atl7 [Thalictrum thalictroides]|uniref:RING-type E3 ubiquitin transferase n=1 Tax=Thalictrum thalictroides TaxID=46969 RepID=A0A7J6WT02_THATH|nr:Ring-h2 finger protein atl7 [Thalictrum thalictroides]
MSYSYSDTPSCCSSASAELKLYQAFIFSIPIFFTFILLFLFYLFYLRRRRVNWSSMQMRALYQNYPARLSESGLKKEVREMLPIIVFKESFSIKDTQCSVCLGDYQAEDRLQQIPVCGHTFHMDCIDHWLATHTTCPLCRLSLVPAAKSDSDPSHNQGEIQAIETVSGIVSVSNIEDRRYPQSTESARVTEQGSCDASNDEMCDMRRADAQSELSVQDSVVLDIESHDYSEEVSTAVNPSGV